MKTKIVSVYEKAFEPFVLSITVQSIEEARLLFHLSNCSISKMKTFIKGQVETSKGQSTEVADNLGDIWERVLEQVGDENI